MSSPLEQAGAVKEPSEYAALSMDRGITGLWTQRSPLRDADVPYLYGKFYSASRFDSLIDGLNREISAKLTYRRRPGSSVYNSNNFPAGNSFYPYKRISNGMEILSVLYDGVDGVIYDATAGQKSTLFTKAAGAGKARFQGVNTSLYLTDGVENKKWLQPGAWQASTNVAPGALISVGANPGTLQMALGGMTLPIVAFASDGTNVSLWVDPTQIPQNFVNLARAQVAFSGFATATFLNGNTYPINNVLSATLGIFQVTVASAVTAQTRDAGSGSTGNGVTGGSGPAFSTTEYNITADGGQQWKCYGPAIQEWGLVPPPAMISNVGLTHGTRFWQRFTAVAANFSVLDGDGNVQYTATGGTSGLGYPAWKPLNASHAAITQDGTVNWENLGKISSWAATTAYIDFPTLTSTAASVILDSNGNLQWSNGVGTSGGSEPVWGTTVGAHTADGSGFWLCLGPGTVITTASVQYAFSTRAVDGSVSTASPALTIPGGILGAASALLEIDDSGYFSFNVDFTADRQITGVRIWRTAQGQSTLVLADDKPVDFFTGTFQYSEYGVPDTALDGGGALNALIAAPVAQANNPPPIGMTAPLYHLGRIWAIYKNTVICSGGPDTLVGNGNTAFAPLSSFPIPEQPIRLFSAITNAGPARLVWGRANIYAILGQGTPANPFQQASMYMAGVGIQSYDAVTQIGSTFYAFGNSAKIGGNLVGKAFSLDPGGGYVEYGFPIGDQFANVTTGAGGRTPDPNVPLGYLYNPASTFVAWAELGSGDTALYVADGSVGWFRYSPVASPESGFLWSPRAVFHQGTSAVQGIETEPGVSQLLLAPSGDAQGTASLTGAELTWISGPQFDSSMVGKNATITDGDSTAQQTIIAFIDATHITLAFDFGPGPVTVSFSIPKDGPILFRDSTVNADWNGSSYEAYPSYDVKGCIQLCLSGEVGEVAHVHLISAATGERPYVGMLFGEVLATTAAPFAWYARTCSEPPNLPASNSLYSDRYTMLSKGVTPKCLFFQLGMDYGTQNYADETLMFSIFGAKYAERRQQ